MRANPRPDPNVTPPGRLKRHVTVGAQAIVPQCPVLLFWRLLWLWRLMRANPRPGPQRNAPWGAKTGSPHNSQGHYYPMGAPWVVVLVLVLALDEG